MIECKSKDEGRVWLHVDDAIIRRLIAAALAIIMALSLSVSAFAVEYDTHIDPNCPVCNPGVTQDSKLNAISDALAAVLSFSDVSSTHTFHDAIIWCANQSIVGGYTDGSFKPANTVSRSNFVVMLSRAFYASDIKKYTNDFTLSYGAFYPNYLALANNGIWNNVSFDEDYIYTSAFAASMNKGISRYDMAQLMTNIMTKKGFSASANDKNAAIAKITDYNSIPSQYRDAVANVYALGVIGGYSDGSFNGDGVMNRGQAAVVIYRMMQYTGNSGGDITNPDPETPVDPSTGEVVCACVTVHGKLCEICHTAQTGNTTPVEPEKPETPNTPAAGTLTNGKPITVENVTELMNELRAQYPAKTDTGRYSGPAAIRQITTTYTFDAGGLVSTKAGCGGWAARVFDYIFGQDVAFRQVSYDEARVGDLIINVDNQGRLMHVAIISDRKTINGIPNMLCTTDANIGNNGVNVMLWDLGRPDPDKYGLDFTYDIYTAYPD